MRIEKKRFKVGKLFVLGAGASYSATRSKAKYGSSSPRNTQTPLDKHFTSELLNLKDGRSSWIEDSVKEIKKSWKDHIPFDELGLEEAILTHAANMRFITAIRTRRGRNKTELDEYLNHLVHLIAYRLRRAKQGKQVIYKKFVNKFFATKRTQNRIITFNYDDVLDNCLINKHKFKDIYSPEILLNRQGQKPSVSKNPLLLKLHGSVNWNCMTDNFEQIILQDSKNEEPVSLGEIWFRKTGCPKPDDQYSPCIIPPMEFKPITEVKLFRSLWTIACEYLHECKELYICGYSLPPTDALAASLFKEFKNSQLKAVTVIDPDPSIMTKWRRLLFRKNVNSAKWSYFADFGEFVESSYTPKIR